MRYELNDFEWTAIKPMLPNKPRGVRRVNDRRMLNGIFWVLRSGAPWRDLPKNYGQYTTCYNRFVRWRRAGVWDQIMDALTAAHDAIVQMIDTSVVRVHQHGDRSRTDAQIAAATTRAGCLFFESSSRPIFLFEHDLRANASRLSRGKTGTHLSGSCSRPEGLLRQVLVEERRQLAEVLLRFRRTGVAGILRM
jgi:transposase